MRGDTYQQGSGLKWMPICSHLFYLRFYRSPTSPSLPPPLEGFLFLLQHRVSTVILVVSPSITWEQLQCLFLFWLHNGRCAREPNYLWMVLFFTSHQTVQHLLQNEKWNLYNNKVSSSLMYLNVLTSILEAGGNRRNPNKTVICQRTFLC